MPVGLSPKPVISCSAAARAGVAIARQLTRAARIATRILLAIDGRLLRGRLDAVRAVEQALAPAGQGVHVEAGDLVEVFDAAAVTAPRPAEIADALGDRGGHDGVLVGVAVAVHI